MILITIFVETINKNKMHVSIELLSESIKEMKETVTFLIEVQKIMDKKITKKMVSNLEGVPKFEINQLLSNLKIGVSLDKAIEISKDPKRYTIKFRTDSDFIEIIDKQKHVMVTDSFFTTKNSSVESKEVITIEYFDETETLDRFILSIFNNTPVSEIKSLEYIELINLDPLLRQMVLNLLRKGWNLENVFKLLNEKI